MKKLFLTLMLSAAVLAGCDFFVDPVAYNDKIVEIDNKAIDAYDAYVTAADSTPLEGDFDALNTKREETITQIKGFKTELEAVGALKDDASLRDVFMEDLDAMIQVLETEEKELIDVWKRMGESETPSDADTAREEELMNTISEKSEAMYQKVKTTQEAFATEHGYELEPETFQP